MTIDKMIDALNALKEKVGGNEEVPVVLVGYGENDYAVPDYPIVGNFVDQDWKKYKCALVASMGGEEFTEDGTQHYEWKSSKNAIEF